MKNVHVINSLGTGGAERTLISMLEVVRKDETVVVLMTDRMNTKKEELRVKKKGIFVKQLGIKGIRSYIKGILLLIKLVDDQDEDVTLIAWLYHSWIITSITYIGAKLKRKAKTKKIRLIYNVRSSPPPLRLDMQILKERISFQIAMMLSRLTNPIYITCSKRSLTEHIKLGYKRNRYVVIENGIDYKNIHYKKEKQERIKHKLGINKETMIIGWMGRAEKQKNIDELSRLIQSYFKQFDDAIFIAVGRGATSNKYLRELKNEYSNRVEMIEETDDPAGWLSAIEVFISMSKYGEAYPNVVAEAVTCGCYVMGFDVGGTKQIVGKYGIVVSTRTEIGELTLLLKKVVGNAKKGRMERCTRTDIEERSKSLSKYQDLEYSDD